jgi:serine/threonine-protein kinase
MELVDGLTLDVWMEKHPRPDLDAALVMLTQICSGVAAIHAASTVHRDIKPSNILVDDTQRPRVADLGLAILLRHEGDLQHEIVGTPAYMAPEVAFPGSVGDGLGDRADVYSLACVAYELLTGRLPFVTDGDRAMMFQHAVLPPQPPSVFRADLPRTLDDAIMHALAKKPAERTPTVEAFRAALEAARTQTLDPPRILIADDNDDFRELLASGLEGAFPSSQIECVRDGRAALDAFDRSRPSVMICDLAMPNLGGMALAHLLRTRDPGALVAILVLTGSGGPEEWARLSAIGVHRLLVKPVVLDDVVSIIRRLMKHQTMRVAAARGTDMVTELALLRG